MSYYITSRRVTINLLELVPNPFDDINKKCSKRKQKKNKGAKLKKMSESSYRNDHIKLRSLSSSVFLSESPDVCLRV